MTNTPYRYTDEVGTEIRVGYAQSGAWHEVEIEVGDSVAGLPPEDARRLAKAILDTADRKWEW